MREALAGLAALPEMQREALLRTAVEGGSHRDVAHELGLSEHALRGLVYRARATLRAAAGAIVPPPLLTWALGSGTRGAPVLGRLAEMGAGGGSAGVAGVLMKGGAIAVTASVLAGGIVAVHGHPTGTHARPYAHRLRRLVQPAEIGASVTLASGRAASSQPLEYRASSRNRSPTGRSAPWRNSQGAQPKMPFTTKIAPAGGQTTGSSDEHPQQSPRESGGERQSAVGGPHDSMASTGAGLQQGDGGGAGGSRGEQHGEATQQGPDTVSTQGTKDGGPAQGASSSDGRDPAGEETKSEGPSEGASRAGKSTEHEDSPSKSDSTESSQEQATGAEAKPDG